MTPSLLPVAGRRRFIRTLALGGAVSILGKLRFLTDLEAQITPSGVPSTGLIRIRISDFPVLQSQNGSVRLGINPSDLGGPSGQFYPVMINRGAGALFYAMTTQCQHAGCMVESFSSDFSSIVCFCHGSQYAIDGAVIQGPASRRLTPYSIAFDGQDTLTVQIPNLGYQVDLKSVTATPGPRVQLDFPTFVNSVYRAQFRQKLTDPWAAIPFSLSRDGAADQTSITGTGSAQSVWASKTTASGFYSITLDLLNYG